MSRSPAAAGCRTPLYSSRIFCVSATAGLKHTSHSERLESKVKMTMAMSAVGSALNGILVAALYQYAAQGTVPEAFDADLLAHSFAPKATTG